ncbi:cyclic-phosphate processing receiver domain-containing protein [Streptomyces mirabilis]|uniref:cyclic-phosphate processing receiver domain-containing protein n=1 Tax=Streptomyces mirabilis TaxID=68239 RepID=UPI0036EF1788
MGKVATALCNLLVRPTTSRSLPPRYLRPLYRDDGQVKVDSPLPTPVILGIDDLRPLPRATRIARTSGEGIQLLQEHRDSFIDKLWLDHDLGGDDSILPVVTLMEEAAFNGRPFRIGTVFVHSANPIGAETVGWNYQVRRATA